MSKTKNFFSIFFRLFKSYIKFLTLDKKIRLSQLMYLQKYRLREKCLDRCLKSRVSEDPQTDNKANGSKHCCNLNSSTFTLFINHCEFNCIGNSLFLVIHKILRLFVTTLRVNDKHFPFNRDNLVHPIQMQLSQKQKILSQFFFVFLKSILNFKIFTKKDDPRS